jgi:hypothetical protein
MADMSDIEDGFALKRQRRRAIAKKKIRARGKCTIPPPPAKHILDSFTLATY